MSVQKDQSATQLEVSRLHQMYPRQILSLYT